MRPLINCGCPARAKCQTLPRFSYPLYFLLIFQFYTWGKVRLEVKTAYHQWDQWKERWRIPNPQTINQNCSTAQLSEHQPDAVSGKFHITCLWQIAAKGRLTKMAWEVSLNCTKNKCLNLRPSSKISSSIYANIRKTNFKPEIQNNFVWNILDKRNPPTVVKHDDIPGFL